jgi:hypothetical protein
MHAALFLGAAVITMTLGRFDRELHGEDGPLLRSAYRREIERAVDRVKGTQKDRWFRRAWFRAAARRRAARPPSPLRKARKRNRRSDAWRWKRWNQLKQ